MGIIINQSAITPDVARQLISICPFGAFDYKEETLSVTAACKGCRLCVKRGPIGAISWEDEEKEAIDKSLWSSVCVLAEERDGKLHPVCAELLGKARELASVTNEPVAALVIGHKTEGLVLELLSFGADKVFVYDEEELSEFKITPYANAFYDYIQKEKPSSILVGATNLGRSLAPKVAARCRTGLTADCTRLEMKENGDLVQIRPAFGGNIMAQIISPDTRPQFCTVRYKIFSAPEKTANPKGEVIRMEISKELLASKTKILSRKEKEKTLDISDAELIVACGRGIKSEADLSLAKELAEELGATLACSRPLVESGWMDPRCQIGLSGRTVKPKLLIALGISGSVQFAAGMNGSDKIVAINSDPGASIFNIADVGLVGDLYEIVPMLIEKIKEGRANV